MCLYLCFECIPSSLRTSVNETSPLTASSKHCYIILPKLSNVTFTSLLTIYIDEELVQEGGITINQQLLISCPQPVPCEKSVADSNSRNGYHSSRHSQIHRIYYTSYWSEEAITAALEVCNMYRELIALKSL